VFRFAPLALAALAAPALADPMPPILAWQPEPSAPAPVISPYIYLNRCVGGCTVTGGASDDARVNRSQLPCANIDCSSGACFCPGGSSGTWTVHEFANQFGQIGANGTCLADGTTQCTMDSQCPAGDTCDTADKEWAAVVQCIKEVYSPYAAIVTDVKPTGFSYTEAIIAGMPIDIGYQNSPVGGIAPGTCTPLDNVISFSFANLSWGRGQQRILTLCGVASQETAHAFGLDHEYEFLDGTTAATDPMSYRNDCGGQKFFRNKPARCGEYAPRDCKCGGTQNSHQLLMGVFGAGTSLIPPPSSTISAPTANALVAANFPTIVSAGSKREVGRVELWLNGYNWASQPGTACGADGQPDPSSYVLVAPSAVPDSIIDIVVKAYDDLEAETDSQTVTVTKGAACVDASSCAKGQDCANGRCFWNPPTGQLGDPCTYPQFCTSGICQGTAQEQICTQACLVGVDGSCPMGYDCLMTNGTDGVCFPHGKDGTGCCSASDASAAQAGVATLLVALAFTRRRCHRRRARR
jgi:hypothetical protein